MFSSLRLRRGRWQTRAYLMPFMLVMLTDLTASTQANASSAQPTSLDAEHQTQSLMELTRRHRQVVAGGHTDLQRMVAVARERQKVLAELVEHDPGAVLRATLPPQRRASLPVEVRKHVEREIVLEGELEAVIEHGPGWSRTRYFIRDDQRALRALYFKTPPTQLDHNGLVRVRGLMLGSVSDEHPDATVNTPIVVYSGDAGLQFLAPDGGGTSSATGGTIGEVVNPIGEQTTLVMLINFQDTANETPFTLAQAHDSVFGTVNDFFYEASYAQTWLAGVAHGWYTLPINSTCNTTDISTAADAAVAASGVDLSAYGRLIYVMQGSAECFWSGASDMWVYPSRAWLNGNIDPEVIAHELGHGFGLHHSNLLECGDTVLGPDCMTVRDDKFDTMGASPEPGHFNVFQKERLGWLMPDEIVTVGTDGTYNLQPIELTGGTKAIKILKEQDPAGQGATWYYLEYRQALGFDAFIAGNDNVLNGLLIHTGADFDGSTSLLLDMTPNSSSLSFLDRNDPALIVGQSFTDPLSGVTIATTAADPTGSTVNVSFSQPSCVRGNPIVALSPPESQWVAPATPVTYDVTVTNADSGCPAATFDLFSTVPAGWTSVFDSNVLTLQPGGSGSTVLTATSATTAPDGFYDIDVTVVNGVSVSYTATATAAYVVSAAASNSAPTAVNDEATTGIDTAVVIDVLANDTDPDGDTLFISQVTTAANGTVSSNADGTVSYLPAPRFKGTDGFEYTVSDGFDSAVASATITVRKNGGGGNGGGGSGGGKGGGGKGKGH